MSLVYAKKNLFFIKLDGCRLILGPPYFTLRLCVQGVLVFVVLVCKKKTVKRVASRVRGRGVRSSTYPSTSRFNSTYSNTTRWRSNTTVGLSNDEINFILLFRTSVVQRDRDSTREVVPKDLLLEKETLEMCLVHANSMAD